MADILKRLGARNCSVEEVKQLYFTTQSSVAPHRPKRKQTVEFKGNSHPERKGKHSGGRRFPAHVKQKYRDADMWYTSDDKRRFETDLISLQIVTSYKDGVENTRKKAIVPQRKFNYSRSSSNRQAAFIDMFASWCFNNHNCDIISFQPLAPDPSRSRSSTDIEKGKRKPGFFSLFYFICWLFELLFRVATG